MPILFGEIWLVIFYVLTGVPAVAIGLYAIIILYYGRKKTGSEDANINTETQKFEPFVSIVVATHNEEMIISKKIENLLSSNYPLNKMEIVFADDSTDSTPRLILKAAEKSPNIRLLRFEQRMGYTPCMLAGFRLAEGEIVILNDAGSFLDANAISIIVDRFNDPKIGVVTGKDVILNINEEVGKSESLYQKLYNFLRVSETNMDSTFYIKGEATGVRRSILSNLEVSTVFDHTIGIIARQSGFKVVYDPNVCFYEYAPNTHLDRIRQKTIRAAHLIKLLWRYKSMMFKRRYGKYGFIILPSNFALLALVPILVLVWFGSLVVLTFLNVSLGGLIWSIIGVACLALLLFSRRLLFSFMEFEYSLLKALYQVLFTNKTHDKIEKVTSTRRLP